MAVEEMELPTIEKEVKTPEATEEIDIDGLLAELKKVDVKNVDQLQGKLVASREAGQLANQLGAARAELRELRELVSQQRSAPKADEFGNIEEGRGVDLEATISKVIRNEVARERQMAMQAQGQVLARWNEINGDPDYDLVKEVWEKKLKDPNFNYKVQSGLADPLKEYNGVVREYHKGIAKKALDLITLLQKGGKIPVPHVEAGGGPAATPTKEELSDRETKLKKLRESASKGGKFLEEDALEILDLVLS